MHNATSYSDMQTYGRCPKKYFFRNVVKIQRKKKNATLYEGTETHEGMKTFFIELRYAQADTMTPEDAFDRAYTAMMGYFDQQRDMLWENNPELMEYEVDELSVLLDNAETWCRRYLDEHRNEVMGWEILHVEEEFIIMIGNDIVSFTPDLIVRDPLGYVWIRDHKTTSKTPTDPTTVPFSGNAQALIYSAGVKELYPDLKGFVFSFMRKKIPVEPRLNKSHTAESKAFGHLFVNDVSRVDTTYRLLRDFIMENAPALMGEPKHAQRLADLRDSDTFFWDQTILISDEQTNAILENVDETLEMMTLAREHMSYPMVILGDLAGVYSCQRCEFSRICHSELLGFNTEVVIEEDFEPRDPKNPYESEDADADNDF